jgi:hypothetical protein
VQARKIQGVHSRLLTCPSKIMQFFTVQYVKFVLYRCETSLLTVRGKHKYRMYENSLLKRTFGLRDKVTGCWKKICNEEYVNPYLSSNISL